MKYLLILLALCMIGCSGPRPEIYFSIGEKVNFSMKKKYVENCKGVGHITEVYQSSCCGFGSEWTTEYVIDSSDFETNKYCPTKWGIDGDKVYYVPIEQLTKEEPYIPVIVKTPIIKPIAIKPIVRKEMSAACELCVKMHLRCLLATIGPMTEKDIRLFGTKEKCESFVGRCIRENKCK